MSSSALHRTEVPDRLAWNEESAIAFQNLPDEGEGDEVLLLLPDLGRSHTCACVGVLQGAPALHHKVEHIWYDPRSDLTTNQQRQLSLIPTVVIAVCEMEGTPMEGKVDMPAQQRFAEKAVDAYHVANEGTEPPALAILYFGTSGYEPPPGTPICLQYRTSGEGRPDSVGSAAILALLSGKFMT